MSDADHVEALLDIVDESRPANPEAGPRLAVFGLAELTDKKRYQPTNAGWVLLGARGRAFRTDY